MTASPRVYVYRNTTMSLWTVSNGRLVVTRKKSLTLFDCKFLVRPGGVASWRRTRRKNVHAFVVGTWEPLLVNPSLLPWFRIHYRPDVGHFYGDDPGVVLTNAGIVDFRSDGSCWAVAAPGNDRNETRTGGRDVPRHGSPLSPPLATRL